MNKAGYGSPSDPSILILENRIEDLQKEEKALKEALQKLKGMRGKDAIKPESKERNKGVSEKVEEILKRQAQISTDDICLVCRDELTLVNPDGLRGSVQTLLSKMKQRGEVESLSNGIWRKRHKVIIRS